MKSRAQSATGRNALRQGLTYVAIVAICWAPMACGREDPAPNEPLAGEIGQFLEPVESIRLLADASDPIGSIDDVVAWDTGLAIADGLQSNVKVFDRAGTLLLTFGRLGDGPGEFRSPVGLQRDEDGSFVVLDRAMRLSRFSAQGAFEVRYQVQAARGTDLEEGGAPGEYLLAARITAANGNRYGAGIIDTAGLVIEEFHELPEDMQLYRTNFLFVFTAGTDHYLVTMDGTTNELKVRDTLGGDERTLVIDAPWYRAPEYPSTRLGLIGLTDWGNTQMWGQKLEHVDGDRVLVAFACAECPDAAREGIQYTIVDIASGRQLADTTAMDGIFSEASAGKVYVPRWEEDDVYMDVYEVSDPAARR